MDGGRGGGGGGGKSGVVVVVGWGWEVSLLNFIINKMGKEGSAGWGYVGMVGWRGGGCMVKLSLLQGKY